MKNLLPIASVLFMATFFIKAAFAWGEVQPAYKVDLELILGGIIGTVLPFCLGWLSAKWYEYFA